MHSHNNTWSYFNGTATTFIAGKGYIVKRTTDGTVTFEGTTITYEKNTTTDLVTLTIDGADDKLSKRKKPYLWVVK